MTNFDIVSASQKVEELPFVDKCVFERCGLSGGAHIEAELTVNQPSGEIRQEIEQFFNDNFPTKKFRIVYFRS